ncbi:DeoR/GlpR family DNA-binding transcription regulator [Rhizobium oryzicola]|uniref:DeoR/GlpR family DNA-binding transcription regulator n=1 Tax=Rhizobium oryzicola TaxID=1232668 RepID=A0ABT8SSK3_9HYPH|nr:DeoR/GlpR family DNA-binding transcription regulator [Rhizobium oryzicola]MDO1581400.1 DeoR/GlpR family DNA-binding transcription regulator [Rhizobium oryzicola]
MLTSKRKQLILDTLRKSGGLIARDFAVDLGVSEDTIRRDLRDMAAEGLLQRVHGGALPIASELPDLTTRRTLATDVKDRLGQKAASLIQPRQTLFFDGGTSTAAIARHLPKELEVTIVTHSPTIAAELEHHAKAEVVLIGGRLYKHSMVSTGAAAMAQISQIRPDIFFLGVTGIHHVEGCSTGDFEEAQIKAHVASRAVRTITLITENKLDTISPQIIAPITTLAAMIVPAEISDERLAAYCDKGVEILFAR